MGIGVIIAKPLRMAMAQQNIKTRALAIDLEVSENTICGWRTGRGGVDDENFKNLLNRLNMVKSTFFALGE